MESGQIFVLCIIALSMVGGTVSMLLKTGHDPLHDMHGRIARRRVRRGQAVAGDDLDDSRKVELLTSENERLTGKVSRLEERLAVLERIATDPAERVAREIDALR
jgi:hypothetical protein